MQGLAYYQGKNYTRADSVIGGYVQKWPDDKFGWSMEFNIKRAMDTSMVQGLAVSPALKYLEVLEKDTTGNKKTIIQVAGYLAQYYANIAKDKEKALVYLQKMLALDPTNADIKKYVDDMKSLHLKQVLILKVPATPKTDIPKQAANAKSKTTIKNTIVKK
jgi:hypothetical protein